MKFKIAKEMFGKFPQVVIGVVVARGINNEGISEEVIGLIREKEREIRKNFNVATLSQEPKIAAWRAAYSAFDVNSKEYNCSVENLYRMILRGIELRHINKIVDIYNYISIKHIVPVGGDDIDKIEGDIFLRFAKGDETFRALNSEEIKTPKSDEVIYCDSKEVLCRRWNWRECDKSKMTEATKNVMLVVEGLPPVSQRKVEEIIGELARLIRDYCEGDIQTSTLNRESSEIGL